LLAVDAGLHRLVLESVGSSLSHGTGTEHAWQDHPFVWKYWLHLLFHLASIRGAHCCTMRHSVQRRPPQASSCAARALARTRSRAPGMLCSLSSTIIVCWPRRFLRNIWRPPCQYSSARRCSASSYSTSAGALWQLTQHSRHTSIESLTARWHSRPASGPGPV
jgi:hypothetical protein